MSVCKERAWETLKKLSFERVAGTEEEKRAAEMILEEMQKAGVSFALCACSVQTVLMPARRNVFQWVRSTLRL